MKITSALQDVDQRIHLLCQVIAKANRTFVSEREDDSHTNLYFDPTGRRVYGRWIKTEMGEVIMALELDKLRYVWYNDEMQAIRKYDILGKHLVTVERKIDDDLMDIGLEPDGFLDELHFEIPDYDFTRQEFSGLDADGLNQWCYYRQLANEACLHFVGHLQGDEEFRIWPHHFDTGVYFEQNYSVGLGFGFAMNDDMVGEQYFYLAGYHLRSNFNYDDRDELSSGKWIIDDWKGAVLPLSEVQGLPYDEKLAKISKFIREVTAWYMQAG